MQSKASTIEAYLDELPEDRREKVCKLRAVITKHLPEGFKEQMIYGMIGYVVPLNRYPAGYHCDPSLPLSFMCLASQKNFIALYHMGIYADAKLPEWFTTAYPEHCKTGLDLGKSCIRFKKTGDIPYDLIAELCEQMTV